MAAMITMESRDRDLPALLITQQQMTRRDYDMIDLVCQINLEITSHAISHNLITAIGIKQFQLSPHHNFRAETEIQPQHVSI